MPQVIQTDIFSYLGTMWPSGQLPSGTPGWNLEAFLSSMRSNFGFNNSPHEFELTFIPVGSGHGHGASGNLPPINTDVSMWISGFFLRGLIHHIDWASSDAGTTITMGLRDRRQTLDKYKITTTDIDDNLPSGVVSVPKHFRETNGITHSVNRYWPSFSGNTTEIEAQDQQFKEYMRILENGATYPQIWNAINDVLGTGISAKLPTIVEIQSNVSGDISSWRFTFTMSPLSDAISEITLNTSFDWYWHMGLDKVALINRKTPFSVPESQILTQINAFGGSGIDNVKAISYGLDAVDESSRVHLLGAYQEGIMNSVLLSPLDGLDTIYDGLTSSGTLVFEGAWGLLTVGFYDASGFYRTYVPCDKELQMALAGPEQWTYFKKYQASGSPDGWGLPQDEGSIAAQHPDFQSRLDPREPIAEILSNPENNIRVINNRRDLVSNWVLEFYQRLNQHAQRHYGKTYLSTSALTRDNQVFLVVNEAWCGVENEKQEASGLYVDDYEINRRYGPISPFITQEGKVTAHVKLPSGTVYGPLGEDTPSSFGSWTEDAPPFNPSGDGSHYIPCEIGVVGQRIQDPRRDDNFSFEPFPENTVACQLPEIASSGMVRDDILGSLATLTEYALQLGESGLIDLIDPRNVVIPYTRLSGVAIPVRSVVRYGQNFPVPWVSGNENEIFGTRIEVDDDLAPWNTYPEGDETSIEKLNRYAHDKVNSLLSYQTESQYMEVTQVGLPEVSFDDFASQTPNVSGYVGEREHGVNQVSIDYSPNGLVTTYRIQSYYKPYLKPAPLTDRTRFRLNGVINPIDYTDLGKFLASFGKTPVTTPTNNLSKFDSFINFDFERQEACEIITIHHIFNESAVRTVMNGGTVPTEERYYGVVKRKRAFVYGETNYVLQPGNNTVAHNLNSLRVFVTFIQVGSGVGGNRHLPNIEIDPYSVLVFNPDPAAITGTIMVDNGETLIRPTPETIRNSEEVDDYGAVCNDGYLNIGDPCVYVHKRAGGEEIAYFTGGRQIVAGNVIEIEEKHGTTPEKYNVSMLGDAHGRWMISLTSLNNVVLATGDQSTIAGGSSRASIFKPGPDATGYVIMPISSGGGGGGEAVRVTTIQGLGTSGALATVTRLEGSGVNGSTSYSGVYILPYPQFAQSGDLGVMVTYTGASGTLRYVDVNKTGFLTYYGI